MIVESGMETFRLPEVGAILVVEHAEKGLCAFERRGVDPAEERHGADGQQTGESVQLDGLVIDEDQRENRDLPGHEKWPKDVSLPAHVHDRIDQLLFLNLHAPRREAFAMPVHKIAAAATRPWAQRGKLDQP